MTAPEEHWSADISFPALLGAARRPYGRAIRERMAAAGFDDMPRRGSFILGSIARNGPDLRYTAPGMGVTKQAVSQLVDTLVTRGYLNRAPDPADRRRMAVSLTDRGQAAFAESRAAVESVDAALEGAIGAEALAQTRRSLGALAELEVE
jgi:DNA-binding MarR family transcriptional regulator